MILKLAWKEFREHWPIWLTMVVMTFLGLGFVQIMTDGDPVAQRALSATLLLGMGATYGVVCGSMMLAGEAEGGTLVFLDIFLGQRGRLWLWKFLIGGIFAVSEGLTVAAILCFFPQPPPWWFFSFFGFGSDLVVRLPGTAGVPDAVIWFQSLAMVAGLMFSFGMLGSAMCQRVLTGAATAAGISAPVCLLALMSPFPAGLGMLLFAVIIALFASLAVFLARSRELPGTAAAESAPVLPVIIDETDEEAAGIPAGHWSPTTSPVERTRVMAAGVADPPRLPSLPVAPPVLEWTDDPVSEDYPILLARAPAEPAAESEPLGQAMPVRPPQPRSPWHALLWLVLQQGTLFATIMISLSLILGFVVPLSFQVLWPLFTLWLGVACGTATFAREQAEQTYHFLSAQHFPLPAFWVSRIVFWLTTAVISAILLAGTSALILRALPADRAAAGLGSGLLRELMGSELFFCCWLIYGFATGQVIVWLCRKNVLAVLLSTLVSAAALGLWLPSLLCGGMDGWQAWLTPILMLAATCLLVRAWAAGRIKERKPRNALIGFSLAILAWAGLNYAQRAWELPDAGEPIERLAYRMSLPTGPDNLAAPKIQEALAEFDRVKGNAGDWIDRLEEVARLPAAVVETPPSDGTSPYWPHLIPCSRMTSRLRQLAAQAQARGNPAAALQHLVQILALSRNLRTRAPLASYQTGVEIEETALEQFDDWLTHKPMPPAILRLAVDTLARHAAQSPPLMECARAECYRSSGLLENPTRWSYYSDRSQVREQWLAGGITFSLDTLWETERMTRLWRLVWAGLLRGIDMPEWELADHSPEVETKKAITREILRCWMPPADGPGASMTRQELARFLDASWLADDRLFPVFAPLREATVRAQWHLHSCRLKAALLLYRAREGKQAHNLEDLVPAYLPELPVDPYSGQPFLYRISAGEQIDFRPGVHFPAQGVVQPGQAIFWSTGPDRRDDGGRRHAAPNDAPPWERGGFDLISVVPF
jgi:hypothetical protein